MLVDLRTGSAHWGSERRFPFPRSIEHVLGPVNFNLQKDKQLSLSPAAKYSNSLTTLYLNQNVPYYDPHCIWNVATNLDAGQ